MDNHSKLYPFCRVTYWKNHTAASADEDWTACNVTPLGIYSYGEQTFENNSHSLARREALISFLEKAYERGCADAKREIRDVLGVKDPRS